MGLYVHGLYASAVRTCADYVQRLRAAGPSARRVSCKPHSKGCPPTALSNTCLVPTGHCCHVPVADAFFFISDRDEGWCVDLGACPMPALGITKNIVDEDRVNGRKVRIGAPQLRFLQGHARTGQLLVKRHGKANSSCCR